MIDCRLCIHFDGECDKPDTICVTDCVDYEEDLII